MSDEKTVKETGVAYMTAATSAIIGPFVQRGLFENQETAVAEMAHTYIVRQIQQCRQTIDTLQNRYGMNYAQFEAYLRARAQALINTPDITLNQALMQEEDDALDWKIAHEMQASWLGLQTEFLT